MSIGQLKTNQGYLYIVYDTNENPMEFFSTINEAVAYVNNKLSKAV